jgi:pimeloyl-ACP methyl ester carboxylesterase
VNVRKPILAFRSGRRMVLMPFVIAFLAALGVLGAGGYIGSSQAIGYHPEWRKMLLSPEDFGLRSEIVDFQSTDGIQLRAWWLPAQKPGETPSRAVPVASVVLAHGKDENRSGMLSRAAFLVRNGYNVLDVDLRNHGESQGKYMTPGYLEALDILGGVAYLRKRGEEGPIVVLGFSYGAVAALHATVDCPDITAVIADSAFISTSDILNNVAHRKGIALKYKIGIWFARLPLLDRSSDLVFRLRTGVKLDREKASALSAVERIRGQPILFISGENDWLAPPQNALRMYLEAHNSQKALLIVPGAGHETTYRTAPQLYEAKVLDFLGQNLPRESSPRRRCEPDSD